MMNRALPAAMVLLAGFWTLAGATPLSVDSADPDCDDLFGEPAFCSLGAAVAAAGPGGAIELAAGLYRGPENRGIEISASLTVRGAGRGETVLDAEGEDFLFRIEAGAGEEALLSISDLDMVNGAAGTAAVRAQGADLALERVLMGGHAGGAVAVEGGSLSVDESEFADNTAEAGGAIHLSAFLFNVPPENHPRAQIANSSFHGNQAVQGGAVRLDTSSNTGFGDFRIVNSTFSGNSATLGGAILANDQAGLTLAYATFAGNLAGQGSALWLNNAPVSVSHTVLAGPGALCAINPSFEGQSLGYNLAEAGGCELLLDHPSDILGEPAGLGPLADNGGPTPTHLPDRASPLIDSGLAGCKDPDGIPLSRDQRGFLRPVGERCDRGAVEAGESPGGEPVPPAPQAVPALGVPGMLFLALALLLAAARARP